MVIKPVYKLILKTAAKVLAGILFALTLLFAYGGYLNPEHWTLPAVGVLVFPFFAMLTLVVSIAFLAFRKYIFGCIGIGVLMACGPTFLEAVPLRFGNKPGNPDNVFKMVTFNCLHLQDTRNPEAATNRSLEFLINSGADFICLQEMYGFDTPGLREKFGGQVDRLLEIYPYYTRSSHRELAFLSKYPYEKIDMVPFDVEYGGVVGYHLTIDGHPLTVINVHLPSYMLSDEERGIITEANSRAGMEKSVREMEGSVYSKLKKAFAIRARVSRDIAEYAQTIPGNVIICGDFNDVPGSWTYRNFTKRGFEDAYAQTGFGHLITYNLHMMYFHIDQILYRGELEPLGVRKERMDASDHYPLVAEFEFLE